MSYEDEINIKDKVSLSNICIEKQVNRKYLFRMSIPSFLLMIKYSNYCIENNKGNIILAKDIIKCSTKNLVGIEFDANNDDTDFEKMIKILKNSLFIYNENVEQWNNGDLESGGGNAIIRPNRCDVPNYENKDGKSIGIPTGDNGGFKSLSEIFKINGINKTAKQIIDESMKRLSTAIKKYKPDNIYWSITSTGDLGTGIFDVSDIVKIYIVKELKNICVTNGFKHWITN